jgi:electron transfer flavoprotein beta subunit
MKILVPVKQVARLGEGFALQDDGVLSSGSLVWALNEWDACSLEAALTLRDAALAPLEAIGDARRAAAAKHEVVLVTVGGEWAEPALRAGLAMGADRAIRVWDAALDGADALAVAAVLAAVAEAESPELILCGAQSSDMASAATGIALAGLLDLAHVAVVEQIECDGERLSVQRELEGGAVELLGLELPALLTVQSAIDPPRRPNLRAIKQARTAPLSVRRLAEIGLDADAVASASGSRTVRLHERPRGTTATMLKGPPSEIAARIAAIVREAIGS